MTLSSAHCIPLTLACGDQWHPRDVDEGIVTHKHEKKDINGVYQTFTGVSEPCAQRTGQEMSWVLIVIVLFLSPSSPSPLHLLLHRSLVASSCLSPDGAGHFCCFPDPQSFL